MTKTLNGELGTFRSTFAGRLLTPGDDGYDSARTVWNGDIDRRPAVIARCSTAAQVADAIRFARDRVLEISVRGGAHNFAGFAVCEGGLMIDLSPMNQVSVDPDSRRAMVGGGTTWGELDAASQEHGLAVTGGFISHTGVGGLTLGGGMGWLTRKAGLSCDNLLSAEVVTANGRVLKTSQDDSADLFWALRGGGGNFGVVTRFEFRLNEVGPLVNLGLFFWGADRGVEALKFSRDFVRDLPENNAGFIAGLSAPPAPFVPEQYQLAPGFALAVVGFGSAEEHARVVQPIRDSLPPLWELVTPLPYTQLQQIFDEGNPFGVFAYDKGINLEGMSDQAIDVMAEHLPRKSSPLSLVPIYVLDGAYSDVGDDQTAFGGKRAPIFAVGIIGVCPVPELLQAERLWVRSFWDALRPHASEGSYINMLTEYEEDRVLASYGAAKYERLARIKAEYDPDNVFHLNQNIKPALQPV
jgi:hypothetical protein